MRPRIELVTNPNKPLQPNTIYQLFWATLQLFCQLPQPEH